MAAHSTLRGIFRAHTFLDMNADLAGPIAKHGGRHPLPAPEAFAALLSRHGVGPDSEVVAYDDSRFAAAARLWWLMRSMGYRAPRILNGGYQAFLASGGTPQREVPQSAGCCRVGQRGFRRLLRY